MMQVPKDNLEPYASSTNKNIIATNDLLTTEILEHTFHPH